MRSRSRWCCRYFKCLAWASTCILNVMRLFYAGCMALFWLDLYFKLNLWRILKFAFETHMLLIWLSKARTISGVKWKNNWCFPDHTRLYFQLSRVYYSRSSLQDSERYWQKQSTWTILNFQQRNRFFVFELFSVFAPSRTCNSGCSGGKRKSALDRKILQRYKSSVFLCCSLGSSTRWEQESSILWCQIPF